MALAWGLAPAVSQAVLQETFTFDDPVVTGSSQAPGVWYTDRYAPAGFTSPVAFGGDNRLQQSISAADGANSRPSGYSSSFYNTQGRKYDVLPGSYALSIDLYIPSDWATTGRRMAGIWGTAVDASDTISAFPIVEFTSDGTGARFQGWDSSGGSWMSLGLPTGFAYDAWYTLNIDLVGTNFEYSVGDAMGTVPALGSTQIDNTILQGHNTTDGVSYDIYWDNLTVTAVPEASSFLAVGLAALGTCGVWRFRNRKAVA